MILFTPAKINLGLHVGPLRPDGYHEIQTALYSVNWFDAVEAIPAETFSFSCYGEPCGNEEDNLCVKAWQLFHQETACPPVHLFLLKHIPAGAGLGGGSSDAAATLRLLDQLFPGRATEQQIRQWAERLGSDCAFFLQELPALAFGRGEQLIPVAVDLSSYVLVLAVPDIHVSTSWAYAELDCRLLPRPPAENLREVLQLPVSNWAKYLRNDFETVVFEKYPLLADLKEWMYRQGALYASMSGSGSCIYGIFESIPRQKPEGMPFRAWKVFSPEN
ncbi:MAG: 4-(cytidine 5'-diphospho)-2-C-methyl-D-erythritol kinase [Chitinophagales bacterium]|nr:4-(cytidine 5'-diphospho)-2-C-methyl-D-erythritol kinase [Chitinophagales bacterium]MDW8427917.1 4-(cytidine 5'-diphospho)-2-C-methyl-D-erythritol kinase [Chitinophagales bacterium]